MVKCVVVDGLGGEFSCLVAAVSYCASVAAGGRYFSGTCNLVARIDIEMVCLSSLGAVLSRVFGICAGVTPRSQCALKLFC